MSRNSKKVVILGAGGHAHVIADAVASAGDVVIAFLDDDINAADRAGCIRDYVNYKDAEFVIGIGNAEVREKLASELKVKWYTAVHKSAVISKSAQIGEGTVIMPNAVVNARATVGNHCIINTGAVVEHDDIVMEFAHISVGAKLGGNVNIGKSTWVGIGATVINNVSVCGGCIIGAGATVVKNIYESGKYTGLPAKKI